MKAVNNKQLENIKCGDSIHALQQMIELREKEYAQQIIDGKMTKATANMQYLRLRRGLQLLKELEKMPFTLRDLYAKTGRTPDDPKAASLGNKSKQGTLL